MWIRLLFIHDFSFVFYSTHTFNLVSYLDLIFNQKLIRVYFCLNQTYKYILFFGCENILDFELKIM